MFWLFPWKNTVDEEEIEKLSRPTTDWWNPNGDFAALHSMNKLRVSFIKKSLDHLHKQNTTPSKPLGGFRILDVGCGGGILSEVSLFWPQLHEMWTMLSTSRWISFHWISSNKSNYTIQWMMCVIHSSFNRSLVSIGDNNLLCNCIKIFYATIDPRPHLRWLETQPGHFMPCWFHSVVWKIHITWSHFFLRQDDPRLVTLNLLWKFNSQSLLMYSDVGFPQVNICN